MTAAALLLAVVPCARAIELTPSLGAMLPTRQAPPSQSQSAPPQAPQTPPAPQAAPEPQAEPAPETPKRTGRTGRSGRTGRESERARQADGAPSFESGRASRDPGPSRHELTVAATALGGYDDNLAASLGTGAGTVPTAAASGYTGYFDTAVDYFRGNSARSLRVGGTGNVRTFSDYLDGPAVGGRARIEGRARLGRVFTLTASEDVRYEPLFTSGAGLGGLPLPPGVSGVVPTPGLFERRSFSATSAVSLDQDWSRRDTTRVAYSYNSQRFDDDYGDNRSHRVVTEYRRTLSRSVRARAGYRYANNDYTDYLGVTRPYLEHTVEGGPEIEMAVSRRRSVSLSFGAGASYLDTVNTVTAEPVDAWVPFGSATAVVDVSPTWLVSGGYRRGFSALQGLSEDVYTTDTVFASTSGLVTARTGLQVSGTYYRGSTPVATGVASDFDAYGVSASVRFQVTRTVFATGGYYFYHHAYSDPGLLPTGFPGTYDRHAVRVGVTVWAPVLGAPSPPPQAQGIR